MNQTERLNEILKQLIYSGVIRNQREFGEKLGYKPSFTSQVLKGYRVPSDLPDKIRQVFGIVWDDWDHGERQKTKPPGEKPGGEEDILPDPTKPGIYRDLIQGIIRNSDALVRLTDAMLEERQYIRSTAKAVADLAEKAVKPLEAVASSLERLREEVETDTTQLEALKVFVLKHIGELEKKDPADLGDELDSDFEAFCEEKKMSKTGVLDTVSKS